MRVFVAGASGAIGRRLVPMLVDAGHDVTGTTRSLERAGWMRAAGARPVIVDAFDVPAITTAVLTARPEALIHQLTALGGSSTSAPSDDQLARTARIRREATANLVAAAVEAGTRRFIAQSLALLYAAGPEPHRESDPLGIEEPWMAITLPGIVDLEAQVTGDPRLDGIILRYGLLYGPGTAALTPDGPTTVHVDAAASAAALAVDRGGPGILNIVDDGGPVANDRARAELGWLPDFRLQPSADRAS
jgi:nucleoside-diphosphate-sugar epimerase